MQNDNPRARPYPPPVDSGSRGCPDLFYQRAGPVGTCPNGAGGYTMMPGTLDYTALRARIPAVRNRLVADGCAEPRFMEPELQRWGACQLTGVIPPWCPRQYHNTDQMLTALSDTLSRNPAPWFQELVAACSSCRLAVQERIGLERMLLDFMQANGKNIVDDLYGDGRDLSKQFHPKPKQGPRCGGHASANATGPVSHIAGLPKADTRGETGFPKPYRPQARRAGE